MLQSTRLGLTMGTVILALLPLPVRATPVLSLCSNAIWTQGYHIGELIPLHTNQYRTAIVTTATPLREGYGHEGKILATLSPGAQLTVTGEVWDTGCNQWIAVLINNQRRFVDGNALRDP